MTALHKLQQACERAFVHGEAAPLLAGLIDNHIPAATRVKVYQNNARETYRKTLLASYPVIERLVGDACFRSLAHKYMTQHGSGSGDLQGFGREFAKFLDGEYGHSEFDYLGDVARLEWAVEQALLAPRGDTLDFAALARVGADALPGLQFTLSPSLRLIASRYPILSIWRVNQEGVSEQIDLAAGPQYVAVRREAGDAAMYAIAPVAYELACLLRDGASLGDASASLSAETQSELGDALQALVSSGCVCGFSLAAT